MEDITNAFLQSKIFAKNPWNTYADPFPYAMLRCDCKVTWLQQYCKREGGNERE